MFRNNQYYFYYTAEAKIGVAVGPSPIGPFTDLGYPLIGSDPFITDIIDPAVFVDNDGQAYIYYGGSAQSKMVIRKLASNMTSFIGGASIVYAAILYRSSAYAEARKHLLPLLFQWRLEQFNV